MDKQTGGDLHEAFHQGFGPEPQHRPVSERVEAGHRAVRRRRLVGAVLTVAVATVVGVGAVALLGDGSRGTAPVATDSPSPSTTTSGLPAPDLAHYTDDGTLVIDPSATVLTRIDNPLGVQAPDDSVALDLLQGDQEYWTIVRVEVSDEGAYESVGQFTTPADENATFADWVRVQAEDTPSIPRGDDYIPRIPVRFDQGENLVPVDGIRIVAQWPHPDLPESFAPTGARTAVALIEGRDGRRQWVLARDVDGFDVVKFPASRSGADVEAFLEFARAQYSDGGAGLR